MPFLFVYMTFCLYIVINAIICLLISWNSFRQAKKQTF